MQEETKLTAMLRLAARYAVLSVAVAVLLLAVMAFMFSGGLVALESFSLAAVLIALSAGAFAGGLLVSKKASRKKLPVAALTGVCVVIILLVAGMLFSFPPARHSAGIILAAILPALGGSVISQKTMKKRRYK